MINKTLVRNSVIKAIKLAPVQLKVLRDIMKDDGCGGLVPEQVGVLVGEVTAVFDNSSMSVWQINSGDGGIVRKDKSLQIITVFDEAFKPKTDDYFFYKDQRYVLDKPTNIMELDIAWFIPIKEIKDEQK